MKIRYPIEKMVFGLCSSRSSTPVEGDDIYTTPNLGRLYGDKQTQQSQSHYRRRAFEISNQYDVSVSDNDYVVATSMPLVVKTAAGCKTKDHKDHHGPQGPQGPKVKMMLKITNKVKHKNPVVQVHNHGSPLWYEKMNSKLNAISQEAFTFMQSGLSIVTDFSSLRVPTECSTSKFN